MSWRATAWAEKQKTGAPGCKLLLLVLANYANDKGFCWPSQETLAKGTEQSLDAIQRHARRLEAGGFLTISRQPRAGGRWPALSYQLHVATEPQNAARSPSRKYHQNRAAKCGTNLKENRQEERGNRNEKGKNEAKQVKGKRYEPANVVQNKIAERLGKGDVAAGWEMLMEITDDERHYLTACERNGRLTDAVLDNVRGQCALNGHRKN
jgi:hypothetical protein